MSSFDTSKLLSSFDDTITNCLNDAFKEFLLLFGILDKLSSTSHLDYLTKFYIVRYCFIKRSLEPKQLLTYNNMPVDSMYVLIHGTLEVLQPKTGSMVEVDTERHVVIKEYVDECVIGSRCLQGTIHAPVTIRAKSPCTLYELTRNDYEVTIGYLSRDTEKKIRTLFEFASLSASRNMQRSCLYRVLTPLALYNASYAMTRKLVVRKEVIIRSEVDAGNLVMVEHGNVQVKYYKIGDRSKIQVTKKNCRDGSIFGRQGFFNYIITEAKKENLGNESVVPFKRLSVPGLIIKARAMETSCIILIDADKFIKYSRTEPVNIIKSLLEGDQFTKNHEIIR